MLKDFEITQQLMIEHRDKILQEVLGSNFQTETLSPVRSTLPIWCTTRSTRAGNFVLWHFGHDDAEFRCRNGPGPQSLRERWLSPGK